MTWTTTHELAAFQAAAGDFLRARTAAHTALLTVTASLAAAGLDRYGDAPPEFGWWRSPAGEVTGAYVCTPPLPLLLSRMPEQAAEELAALRAADGAPTPGANGGQPAVEAFAAAWVRRTGAEAEVDETHRLYRLAEPAPPDPMPPGAARVAGDGDRDLLVRWTLAFGEELGGSAGRPERGVDDRLGFGGLTLWEVDGEPVSFAGISRTVAGMARVAPVYTPPGLRGRGYAGAATAAVGVAARDRGVAEVLLFADLANATSNALYQRIGYVPVEDHLVVSFRR